MLPPWLPLFLRDPHGRCFGGYHGYHGYEVMGSLAASLSWHGSMGLGATWAGATGAGTS